MESGSGASCRHRCLRNRLLNKYIVMVRTCSIARSNRRHRVLIAKICIDNTNFAVGIFPPAPLRIVRAVEWNVVTSRYSNLGISDVCKRDDGRRIRTVRLRLRANDRHTHRPDVARNKDVDRELVTRACQRQRRPIDRKVVEPHSLSDESFSSLEPWRYNSWRYNSWPLWTVGCIYHLVWLCSRT